MFTIKEAIGELDRIRMDVNALKLSDENRLLGNLVAELSSVMAFFGRKMEQQESELFDVPDTDEPFPQ